MKFSTLLVGLTVVISSSAMPLALPKLKHHQGANAQKKGGSVIQSNCPYTNPLRARATQEDDGSCEKSKRSADPDDAIANRPQDFAVVPNMKKWQTRDADADAAAAPVEEAEGVQRRALYMRA